MEPRKRKRERSLSVVCVNKRKRFSDVLMHGLMRVASAAAAAVEAALHWMLVMHDDDDDDVDDTDVSYDAARVAEF